MNTKNNWYGLQEREVLFNDNLTRFLKLYMKAERKVHEEKCIREGTKPIRTTGY